MTALAHFHISCDTAVPPEVFALTASSRERASNDESVQTQRSPAARHTARLLHRQRGGGRYRHALAGLACPVDGFDNGKASPPFHAVALRLSACFDGSHKIPDSISCPRTSLITGEKA